MGRLTPKTTFSNFHPCYPILLFIPEGCQLVRFPHPGRRGTARSGQILPLVILMQQEFILPFSIENEDIEFSGIHGSKQQSLFISPGFADRLRSCSLFHSTYNVDADGPPSSLDTSVNQ